MDTPRLGMKITGDVTGGEFNEFVGDNGNYADRHDVMIVGNHHAREWMSLHCSDVAIGSNRIFLQ